MSGNIHLTIATDDYDHVRDFRLGEVKAAGIDVTWLVLGFHEIFARFIANREWDVTEMSFAKFVAEVTRPDADIIGLPVYLRREFRFAIFYVNRGKGIRTLADLRGKRIGLPEWAQTATVYTRGYLHHDAGVPLTEVEWVQAGTNEIGRDEKVAMDLPKGLQLTRIADKTLSDMLAAGEIDGIMGATPPAAFGRHPDVMRLFPEPREMDERYYMTKRVYPIMHVIAMRRQVLHDNPWIARNLYNAFDEAKRRSQTRLVQARTYPLPWLADHSAAMMEMFGGDFFPYGIEENRPALELFLRYAHEQGIAHRAVQPEDIFPPGIMVSARV
jgi:4,5-dihydroxyphthalate decarboxylase